MTAYSSSRRFIRASWLLGFPLACGGRTGLSVDDSFATPQSTTGGTNASGNSTGSTQSSGTSHASGGNGTPGGGNPGTSVGGGSPGGGATTRPYPTQISAGNKFTCAVMSDGTVKCWGYGDSGRLGIDGASGTITAPSTVTGITSAVAVSTGDRHGCALLRGGIVMCWGSNDAGQLGDGLWDSSTVPVRVADITTAVSVTAGVDHTCVAADDFDTVYCWGNNSQCEVGAEPGIYLTNIPTLVQGLYSGVSAIGAGRAHTCVISASSLGPVSCWGSNSRYQLGFSDTSWCYSQPQGGNANNAVALAVGDQHSCVLIGGANAGTVQCWGWGYYGQLGAGNTQDSAVASNVFGITSATAVTAANHSCALLADGTVRCWGFNNSGELGDGTNISNDIPLAVQGLSNVTQITAGAIHTCALLNDASVKCWGDNTYGQLGNGTTTTSYVPVQVVGF